MLLTVILFCVMVRFIEQSGRIPVFPPPKPPHNSSAPHHALDAQGRNGNSRKALRYGGNSQRYSGARHPVNFAPPRPSDYEQTEQAGQDKELAPQSHCSGVLLMSPPGLATRAAISVSIPVTTTTPRPVSFKTSVR